MEDKKIEARVHSVESFGTLDGPGIRFVLFLQGCNLKCKYCHNRDTWDMKLGQLKTLDEIFNKILRYKNYIKNGGVTITGGEPLLQYNFLIALFTKLKEVKIHTCIDTSGMVALTEKFLLDIKHIDPEKCKKLVGFSNEKELDFAKYLSEINKPMWIRQVLIPGITDDEQDLLKLKKFISSLNSVEKMEFLPYHTMGKYKWEDLGLKYELEGVRETNNNDLEIAKKILDTKYDY